MWVCKKRGSCFSPLPAKYISIMFFVLKPIQGKTPLYWATLPPIRPAEAKRITSGHITTRLFSLIDFLFPSVFSVNCVN